MACMIVYHLLLKLKKDIKAYVLLINLKVVLVVAYANVPKLKAKSKLRSYYLLPFL